MYINLLKYLGSTTVRSESNGAEFGPGSQGRPPPASLGIDTGVKGNEACKVLSRVAGTVGDGTRSLHNVDNAYSSPINASVLETHTPITLVHAQTFLS